jgi:hypothetical protein
MFQTNRKNLNIWFILEIMKSVEALHFRVTELEREKKALLEKYNQLRTEQKAIKLSHDKLVKNNTIIPRIASHKLYFDKSESDQRRCKAKLKDMLKSIDEHTSSVGKESRRLKTLLIRFSIRIYFLVYRLETMQGHVRRD